MRHSRGSKFKLVLYWLLPSASGDPFAGLPGVRVAGDGVRLAQEIAVTAGIRIEDDHMERVEDAVALAPGHACGNLFCGSSTSEAAFR